MMMIFPLHIQDGVPHLTMSFGSSNQHQQWIVDTGSRFTALFGCHEKFVIKSDINSTLHHINNNHNNNHNNNNNNNNNDERMMMSRTRKKERTLSSSIIQPNNCPFDCYYINDTYCVSSSSLLLQSSSFHDRNQNSSSIRRRKRRRRGKLHNNSNSSNHFNFFNITTTMISSQQEDEYNHPQMNNTSYCFMKQQYTDGTHWIGYELIDTITIITQHYTTTNNNEFHNTCQSTYNKKGNDNEEQFNSQQDKTRANIKTNATSANIISFPYTVICTTSWNDTTTNINNSNSNGIIGLGPYYHHHKSNSSSSSSTFINELFHHGIILNKSFSICMSKKDGSIRFGNAMYHKHTSIMKYTPIVNYNNDDSINNNENRNRSNVDDIIMIRRRNNKTKRRNKMKNNYYSVHVDSVWLNDICLTCDNNDSNDNNILNSLNYGKGTILDTGTTDTYLPKSLYYIFCKIWYQITNRHYTNESMLYNRYDPIPTVTLIFKNNVSYHLYPYQYMDGYQRHNNDPIMKQNMGKLHHDNQHYNNDNKTDTATNMIVLTSRLYITESVGAVIGMNSMFGYDILFDTDHNRIGIASAEC